MPGEPTQVHFLLLDFVTKTFHEVKGLVDLGNVKVRCIPQRGNTPCYQLQ